LVAGRGLGVSFSSTTWPARPATWRGPLVGHLDAAGTQLEVVTQDRGELIADRGRLVVGLERAMVPAGVARPKVELTGQPDHLAAVVGAVVGDRVVVAGRARGDHGVLAQALELGGAVLDHDLAVDREAVIAEGRGGGPPALGQGPGQLAGVAPGLVDLDRLGRRR
jgi:hypothetical protein